MTRRFELDWLRVVLFALLVVHHVAVGFVDWGAGIYGFVNNQLAGEGMTLFIYWSHSWRLPSLFMIAGIGTWFLTNRLTGVSFMTRRLTRLLVPAIFGAFFLNVFGGYAIAVMTGDPPVFLQFWWTWVTQPEIRQVQHLWFLVNLAVYTLLCWPVFLLRDRVSRMLASSRSLSLAALMVFAASAISVVLLKPHAPALAGDNYQFVYYLFFFLGGYLIGARAPAVLAWSGRYAWTILVLAILLFLAKVTLLALALINDVPTGEALARGGWKPLGLEPANATVFSVIEAATAWAWCITALGLAARYLHRPSPLLVKLNDAVFPVYVLHFPVTLAGLAIVAQFSLPWAVEFLGLLVVVYSVTWLLWRLIVRLGPLVYLVGGKTRTANSST